MASQELSPFTGWEQLTSCRLWRAGLGSKGEYSHRLKSSAAVAADVKRRARVKRYMVVSLVDWFGSGGKSVD